MKTLLAAGISLLLTVAVSLAHDTWLSPSAYSAKPGEQITFDLTSGMEFPKLDAAIKPERVARAGYRIGENEEKLSEFTAATNSLRFDHSFKPEGVTTVWMQLSARDIELSDDDVAHYLEEIRAPRPIEEAWAAQKGKQKWKELYTKCAKTYLRIGDGSSADDSWKEPVGLTLEIIPLQNPTTIRVGATAKFKLLHNGKPVPNAALVLHNGGAKPSYEWTTPEGVATFQLRNAGPAMITSVQLRPPQEGKPWESEFTTVTFSVGAD